MRIEIEVEMSYRLGDDRDVLLAVEVAPNLAGQKVVSDTLSVENAVLRRIAGEADVGQRVWAKVDGDHLNLRYVAQVEVTRGAVALGALDAAPMHALPADVLAFLRPSRMVQSDVFGTFVARRFAGTEGGAKVDAICDWVKSSMLYEGGGSTQATTALDTFAARQGVCRDYVHLFCGLVRAANIPARYAAVYGADVSPPDFHAVAQVWLGGEWHLVDPTGQCAPETLAVIGVARDAGEAAFMETTDMAQFLRQSVRVARVDY